jgi:hypothetical protein
MTIAHSALFSPSPLEGEVGSAQALPGGGYSLRERGVAAAFFC